jgi:hypothetical protein
MARQNIMGYTLSFTEPSLALFLLPSACLGPELFSAPAHYYNALRISGDRPRFFTDHVLSTAFMPNRKSDKKLHITIKI